MADNQITERFTIAHYAAGDWRRAVDGCLAKLSHLPAGANLGFVYFSDHLAGHADDIVAALRTATGIDAFVGTTGLGICATGVEFFDEPAVAVMIASLPPGSFQMVERPDAVEKAWFGVLHADPATPALPETIGDMAEATGAYLIGGLVSSRGRRAQIVGAGVAEAAVTGVMFSEQVEVIAGLSQGCSPVGPVREITAAEGNVIFELDGGPALDAFKADIGVTLANDLERASHLILAGLPVSGADRPDYVVRHLANVEQSQGAIAIGALVEAGQKLMFVKRDGQAAEHDMDRMLDDIKRRMGNRTPRGGLYFSCLGRGSAMFGAGGQELKRIENALGDVPLVGFFGNGEISNARLYGYTRVLALFL